MREAIISLSDEEVEAMGYGELVSLCREAGVRDLELLEDEGRGAVSRIKLKDRLDGDRLDAIESVDDWELIDERAGLYCYLLEVTALELPEDAVVDYDDLVGMCDPTGSDHGLLLSLVGTQESIRAMLRNFEAAGIVPDLHSLGEYEGGERSLDALTDRQLEILQTAYDRTYTKPNPEPRVTGLECSRGVAWSRGLSTDRVHSPPSRVGVTTPGRSRRRRSPTSTSSITWG